MTKEDSKNLMTIADLLDEQQALLLDYRLALNNATKSSQVVLEKLSELLDEAKKEKDGN